MNSDGVPVGFAGLSSLVSKIDTSADTDASPPSSGSKQQPGAAKSEPEYPKGSVHTPGSTTSPVVLWLVGVASIVGLIWLAFESDNYVPANGGHASRRSESTGVRLDTRPPEAKPPIGTNLVLNVAQIRYCLAEDVRLDAARAVISPFDATSVDRFNSMVLDYNMRCGAFQYRPSSLSTARSYVEHYRTNLEAEGRKRFVTESKQLPSQSSGAPLPAATIATIQRRLNELGYNAGSPDGIVGPRTRSAIYAFQRDHNLSADGEASVPLLEYLQALAPSPSNAR